jgi:hypothetical protein
MSDTAPPHDGRPPGQPPPQAGTPPPKDYSNHPLVITAGVVGKVMAWLIEVATPT